MVIGTFMNLVHAGFCSICICPLKYSDSDTHCYSKDKVRIQNVHLHFYTCWLPSLWLILIDTFCTPDVDCCYGNDDDMYIYGTPQVVCH